MSSLFNKQILPILTYGSVLWGIPKQLNCMYINNTNCPGNTRMYVLGILRAITGKDVPIISVRKDEKNKRIFVELKDTCDKCEFVYKVRNFQNLTFTDYENIKATEYEKFHTSFCKHTLNVNKYAPTVACLNELGRYPVSIYIAVQLVKYYIRLKQGTNNALLNSAFATAQIEKHYWYQSIQYIMYKKWYGK